MIWATLLPGEILQDLQVYQKKHSISKNMTQIFALTSVSVLKLIDTYQILHVEIIRRLQYLYKALVAFSEAKELRQLAKIGLNSVNCIQLYLER